jgi:outer membrane protein
MRTPRSLIASAAVIGLLAASSAAQAQQAQNWVGKAGAIFYQTHSETTGIQGIGIPPGADAETGDAWTAIFVIERTITPNIGVELVLGIPPTIDAKATGSVAFLGDKVLSAKNVAPTLLVNYYFGDATAKFRPYLGAGINYTRFTDIKTSLPVQSVDMSDSWGLAVQAGVNYAVDKNWGLFASIARVDVKSDLVAVGSTVLTTTIDFKPITYSFGAWYRF